MSYVHVLCPLIIMTTLEYSLYLSYSSTQIFYGELLLLIYSQIHTVWMELNLFPVMGWAYGLDQANQTSHLPDHKEGFRDKYNI